MPTQPLNEEHYQKILAGIDAAEEAIRQAEMAERAGVDTTKQLATAKGQRDQLLKFKNVYFTGR